LTLNELTGGSTAKRWYLLRGVVRTRKRAAAAWRVLVLLGTLFVIYHADAGAWNSTWAGSWGRGAANQTRPLESQFERLRVQLRSQVPPDHTIYLDISTEPSDLWIQRIGEFAAMSRLHTVTDRVRADYVVTLTPDASAPAGVRLVARPVR
jgi:hypothetical protein